MAFPLYFPQSLRLWSCACGRVQPNSEVRCPACGWLGRAHPRAFEIGVFGDPRTRRPTENERCLACDQPWEDADCRLVEFNAREFALGDPGWSATVRCRATAEAMRADAVPPSPA